MLELMAVTKALSDETRVRLLAALEEGELCVCQLIELVALAPSTVSKHLSILRAARLIEARKQGRWMHYRLTSAGAPQAVQQALDWLMTTVRTLPRIQQDRRRLAKIKETDPGVLCNQQTRQRQGGACNQTEAVISDGSNADRIKE